MLKEVKKIQKILRKSFGIKSNYYIQEARKELLRNSRNGEERYLTSPRLYVIEYEGGWNYDRVITVETTKFGVSIFCREYSCFARPNNFKNKLKNAISEYGLND